LKITSLNVTGRKSPAPSTKAANKPTTLVPTNSASARVASAASVKPAVSAAERRRNQRVLLRIRASIHVALQGKNAVLDAATLSVTPQGAVVVTKQNLPAETHLVLEHRGTGQRVDCRVARPPRETAEGFHTPIEFSTPAPGFWKINFPPSDARPEDA
jgi:hypothetical protein